MKIAVHRHETELMQRLELGPRSIVALQSVTSGLRTLKCRTMMDISSWSEEVEQALKLIKEAVCYKNGSCLLEYFTFAVII